MTALRHQWKGDIDYGAVQLATCKSCGIRRRTRPAAGAIPLVDYLVSGVGWTRERPDCYVPGVEQLSILGAPDFESEDDSL